MNIAGAGVVITGGASGMGRAAAGQQVALDLARGALFEKANVAEESSVAAAIAKTMSPFGAIHICVNCAGIGSAHKTFGKDGHDRSQFDRYLQCHSAVRGTDREKSAAGLKRRTRCHCQYCLGGSL